MTRSSYDIYIDFMQFRDRVHAGEELAKYLKDELKGQMDLLLFGLPRGGIPVAAEVAKVLNLPIDIIVTRKIGAPFNPEYALGALAETGEAVWNEPDQAEDPEVKNVIAEEIEEAKRRIKLYRKGRGLPDMTGKTAVIIDDGVATGATIRAAVLAARHQHAERVIVAVPHGAKESLDVLRKEADEVIVLYEPKWYGAVGEYYETFGQTSDEEVLALMEVYGPKNY